MVFPLSVKLMDGVAGVQLISIISAILQAGAMIIRLLAVWIGTPSAKWSIALV